MIGCSVKRRLWVCGLGLSALCGAARAVEHYHIDEGIAFYAYESKGLGEFRQPLFRLISSKNVHGFTTSEFVRNKLVDAGMKPEDSGIWVLSSPREGCKRLFQFMRKGAEGNIQTILTVSEEGRQDLLKRNDEFAEVESECYVFPPEYNPPFEHLAPIYCLRDPFTDERLYTPSRDEIVNVLKKWDGRKARMTSVLSSDGLIGQGKSLTEIVPVGGIGQVGSLQWRFQQDREILKEGVGKNSPKVTTGFIYFQVHIENTGSKAVTLRPPDLLAGNPRKRHQADIKAAAQYVKEPEHQFKPGMKLEPKQSVELRFVYNLQTPGTIKDQVVECYGDSADEKEITVLDTGR